MWLFFEEVEENSEIKNDLGYKHNFSISAFISLKFEIKVQSIHVIALGQKVDVDISLDVNCPLKTHVLKTWSPKSYINDTKMVET